MSSMEVSNDEAIIDKIKQTDDDIVLQEPGKYSMI